MKINVFCLSLLTLMSWMLPAFAQSDVAPARGIPEALAVEAALSAQAACEAKGNITTTMVADAKGLPIIMLSSNNAGALTQRLASSKANIATKLKMPSGEAARRYKSEDPIMLQLALDPTMGIPLPGGFPITMHGEVIGAIAVSGASKEVNDEQCAQTGLEKIKARLN